MTGARIAAAGLAAFLLAACTAPAPPREQAGTAGPAVCAPPQGAPRAETPTTIDVVEQAYFCVLAHHHRGATMDARVLLTAGFAALTRELGREGRDLPDAVMPALTGDRKADWAKFESVYRKLAGRRDGLAVVTLEAMVAALGDATWAHGVRQHPDAYDGDGYGLGLETNAGSSPSRALPPVFVTAVRGGAARAAGVRPGDVIESVNGSAPFVDGTAVAPAIAALRPRYPEARPVRLRLLRRSTGRRWTVTLRPGLYRQELADLQVVRSKLLNGDRAYVRLTWFAGDSAERILRAIARLRKARTLAGVVLDLRGNGGGSLTEATRLLSAFAHGKVTGYLCAGDDRCEALRTDDTVQLVNLPLTVLVDRGCASACEHFGAAVKDLRLGTLVGGRTAGVVSGPAESYLLGDNTVLSLPARYHLGAGGEVIDGIGVPPDRYAPLTPADAAAGRDPALAHE
ncbi:peptidase [Nonomuraea sp. FMUSA5-5]|uniref:Peptidase n=1 Tax=Nonomuraea composti TaxID=2720023 RepID=A0ABX1B083_9ACTN|nr:S41 family peptidase [Nonomuraea sp. FMUSA5-5]NJP89857.1 peptidase [Nonomuraea sp. FMUSA5-5]